MVKYDLKIGQFFFLTEEPLNNKKINALNESHLDRGTAQNNCR